MSDETPILNPMMKRAHSANAAHPDTADLPIELHQMIERAMEAETDLEKGFNPAPAKLTTTATGPIVSEVLEEMRVELNHSQYSTPVDELTRIAAEQGHKTEDEFRGWLVNIIRGMREGGQRLVEAEDVVRHLAKLTSRRDQLEEQDRRVAARRPFG